METKINVAAILKDKPQGTKLYDLLYNIDVELDTVNTTDTETIVLCINETDNNTICYHGYSEFGTERCCPDSLQILLPSKEMRDWRKFVWKKGDVLVNSSGFKLFFDRWANDDYTRFFGKVNLLEDSFSYETEKYTLASKEETLDTFEIEKPEFKDGDIVTMHKENCDIVLIFNRLRTEGSFYYYAFHALQTNNTGVIDCHTTLPCAWTFFEGKMNFATDSEKQQLFGALAKKGKTWDAEKKQIVDLPKKCEFKAFDKVLVRDSNDRKWNAGFFSHYSEGLNYPFICVGGGYGQCIPYNEETKHLLGTTDEWKEGEG